MPAKQRPIEAGINLLYADPYLIAMNKPGGLLSVPGRGVDKQDCLSRRVQELYPDALIVHRLDMSTSGIMLMARGQWMQSRLSRLFQSGGVVKRYIAVLAGLLADSAGTVEQPIICDWPNRPRQMIDPVHGKASTTHYRVIARDYDTVTTRVELTPVTGRTHQLRLHMQWIGHPIVGDALYAPPEIAGRAERLLLHAQSIGFTHPASGEYIRLSCECLF